MGDAGGGWHNEQYPSAVELPDSEEVASRAEGRPPEERSSEDPKAQAEAILRDSEGRVDAGSAKSEEEESR